jgi:hypothetical protein
MAVEWYQSMAGKTVRLFTLSVLLMAGGLRASAETAVPTENVTVTSPRRAFHEFAKTFATPTMVTGKIARQLAAVPRHPVGDAGQILAGIS